jgi:hypothetical protein
MFAFSPTIMSLSPDISLSTLRTTDKSLFGQSRQFLSI